MRIGINISNGLHRRLKAIGEPVNVSQVCRDAIESIVLEHEELAARVEEDDLRTVITEFADEGEQWSDIDWREYGWTDARDWFKKITREQYERFIYDRGFYLRRDRSPEDVLWLVDLASHIDGVAGFHQRMEEHRDLHDKELDRLDDLGINWGMDEYPRGIAQREYNTAWLAYFNAVHKLIEDKRKQQAEEKFRNRAQMPKPDLPEHLV